MSDEGFEEQPVTPEMLRAILRGVREQLALAEPLIVATEAQLAEEQALLARAIRTHQAAEARLALRQDLRDAVALLTGGQPAEVRSPS